ncbi:MAG: glycerol-3-phosphate 1-O-acyltransferase PlsY [Candidatus Omnitrophica bacterium]|nr:glycerol-3-phosphate 1-O-acyltransferase PlsY [Candidatus Omnitrophota bacterium]
MLSYPIWLAVGYLVGSFPSGYIIGRLWAKKDIRSLGSGNIGATNVYRNLGLTPGATVLFLDIAKGWLPIWLAKEKTSFSPVELIGLGLATVVGHTFSFWLKGRGGKGVATSFGVMLGLFLQPAIVCFLIWLAVLSLVRYVSLASVAGAVALPFLIYFFEQDWILTACGVLVTGLIIWRHRANIQRLASRQENRFFFPWERRSE